MILAVAGLLCLVAGYALLYEQRMNEDIERHELNDWQSAFRGGGCE